MLILTKNIKYILPLSNRDYNLIKNNIKKINNNDIKILYPTEDVYKLLDNKNSFTEYTESLKTLNLETNLKTLARRLRKNRNSFN